jgi:hypothetical protein
LWLADHSQRLQKHDAIPPANPTIAKQQHPVSRPAMLGMRAAYPYTPTGLNDPSIPHITTSLVVNENAIVPVLCQCIIDESLALLLVHKSSSGRAISSAVLQAVLQSMLHSASVKSSGQDLRQHCRGIRPTTARRES